MRPKDVMGNAPGDSSLFDKAKVTRPRIDDQEMIAEMQVGKKRQKFVEEVLLDGESWLEMAREAKAVLDREGGPIGALEKVADAWEALGCSRQVLTWMREGVPMLLEEEPQDHGGRKNYVKPEAMDFANISRLLFVMAVEKDPLGDAEDEGYVFPLGSVPKPHFREIQIGHGHYGSQTRLWTRSLSN